MRRGGRLLRIAGLLVVSAATLLAGPAHAATDGFDHTEMLPGGSLRLTASVPGDGELDLAGTRVTVDGRRVESVAQAAGSAGIARTLMVVVDTRESVSTRDLIRLRSGLLEHLGELPSDVRLGIVELGDAAEVASAPSTDRAGTTLALGSLTTGGDADLADGVEAGVRAAGVEGYRAVLLLAPSAAAADVRASIDAAAEAGAEVQVVSTDRAGSVAQAVVAEAARLERQVVVTAAIPPGTDAPDATVSLSVGTGAERHRLQDRVDVVVATQQQARTMLFGIEITQTLVLAGLGLAVLGVLGALAALLLKPRKQASHVLSEHIGHYGRDGQGSGNPIDLPSPTSLTGHAQDLAARALASNEGLQAKVAARLEGADVDLRPAEWLPLHAVIGIIVGALGLLLTAGNIIGLLVGMLLGLLVPWMVLGMKQSRRQRAFQGMLAETLQLMAGSLQAGLSLAQSIDTIVREGSEPITTEFRRVVVEVRLGVDLEDALDSVADRMGSKDFKWVVMAIRIQRSVGGNLAELLLRVAGTLREREYIRRHVRALSAEGRLSVYVLGGLPPLFLGYLTLTNWEYVGVLFTTPIGWVMLGVMCVLLLAGVTWMSKVSKVAL